MVHDVQMRLPAAEVKPMEFQCNRQVCHRGIAHVYHPDPYKGNILSVRGFLGLYVGWGVSLLPHSPMTLGRAFRASCKERPVVCSLRMLYKPQELPIPCRNVYGVYGGRAILGHV